MKTMFNQGGSKVSQSLKQARGIALASSLALTAFSGVVNADPQLYKSDLEPKDNHLITASKAEIKPSANDNLSFSCDTGDLSTLPLHQRIEHIRQSVVTIRATTTHIEIPQSDYASLQQMDSDGNMTPINGRIFQSTMGPQPYHGFTVVKYPEPSSGAGVVINNKNSEDILIATAGHVVQQEGHIQILQVEFKDMNNNGVKANAEIVAVAPNMDTALIKITEPEKLNGPTKCLHFAGPESYHAGNIVLAMGAPTGLEGSLSKGIISHPNRPSKSFDMKFKVFMQTDASINPGNSGGPLTNENAEIIGLASYIRGGSANTKATGSNGINFAVRGDVVRELMDDFNKEGKNIPGWSGANFTAVDPNTAKALGSNAGAMLKEFPQEGTPAQISGLQQGDIILALDGEKIQTYIDLYQKLYFADPGETTTLTVQSDGETHEVQMTLGDRDVFLAEQTKQTHIKAVQEPSAQAAFTHDY